MQPCLDETMRMWVGLSLLAGVLRRRDPMLTQGHTGWRPRGGGREQGARPWAEERPGPPGPPGAKRRAKKEPQRLPRRHGPVDSVTSGFRPPDVRAAHVGCPVTAAPGSSGGGTRCTDLPGGRPARLSLRGGRSEQFQPWPQATLWPFMLLWLWLFRDEPCLWGEAGLVGRRRLGPASPRPNRPRGPGHCLPAPCSLSRSRLEAVGLQPQLVCEHQVREWCRSGAALSLWGLGWGWAHIWTLPLGS